MVVLLVAVLSFALALPALSATIHVPGDEPNLQAAVAAAASGDTLALADGLYTGPENRGIRIDPIDLTILSVSDNPAACVIDCEGVDRAFLFLGIVPTNRVRTVRGVSFRGGSATGAKGGPNGGALDVRGGEVRVVNCRFERNSAAGSGGGLSVRSGDATVEACVFEDNTAAMGGGLFVSLNTELLLEESLFVGNVAATGGGLHSDAAESFAPLAVTRCVFRQNIANSEVGAGCRIAQGAVNDCYFEDNVGVGLSQEDDRSAVISSSIFVGNTVAGISFTFNATFLNCTIVGNTQALIAHGEPILRNTLIAFNGGLGTCPFEPPFITPYARCCNIFGNTGGDWVACFRILEDGFSNFSADPLFCDLEAGDLTLRSDSPCLPGPTTCGLVGAEDVGCGTISVKATTWGRLKAHYDDGRSSGADLER